MIKDTTIVLCKWCKGVIRKRKIPRNKIASWDRGKSFTKWDYHEDCWCEAIEVQI